MSEAPAIRPHSPRQNRWALVLLILLAVGSFGKGFVQKAGPEPGPGGEPPTWLAIPPETWAPQRPGSLAGRRQWRGG